MIGQPPSSAPEKWDQTGREKIKKIEKEAIYSSSRGMLAFFGQASNIQISNTFTR